MPNFYYKYQNCAYYPNPKSSSGCACHGHRAKLNTSHVCAQNPPFLPMNPYFKLFSFISRKIFIFFGSLGFSFSLIAIIPLLGFFFFFFFTLILYLYLLLHVARISVVEHNVNILLFYVIISNFIFSRYYTSK
jgi:hypothetical protein